MGDRAWFVRGTLRALNISWEPEKVGAGFSFKKKSLLKLLWSIDRREWRLETRRTVRRQESPGL